MKFLEGTAGEGGRSARTDSIMAGKCYWLAAMHLCRDGLMRNVLIRDCLPALTDSGASRRPAVQLTAAMYQGVPLTGIVHQGCWFK